VRARVEGRAGPSGLRRCCGWLLALVLLLPELALAARLTAVRVGLHSGYARVVLETDAPADYEVIDAPAATPDEVAVRIVATSRAREVTSALAGSPVVVLVPQDDGSTLARIRAPGRLRVETQVLAEPPRLVLDLHPVAAEAPPPEPESAQAPAPVAEPELVAPPEPAESPAPDPAPTPIPVAAPSPARVEMAPPPAAVEAPLPPVAAPPRAEPALDIRSFAMGFALGVVLALLAFAVRRPSTQPRDPLVPRSEAQPSGEVHEAAGEPSTQPRDPLVPRSEAQPSGEVHELDLLRMHQRLDARLAEIADRLGELVARQVRLEARGTAQNEEIASQRAAIARLQRSLRPAAIAAPPLQVP